MDGRPRHLPPARPVTARHPGNSHSHTHTVTTTYSNPRLHPTLTPRIWAHPPSRDTQPLRAVTMTLRPHSWAFVGSPSMMMESLTAH